MHLSQIALFACFLLLIKILHVTYWYLLSAERHIPGPWFARFTRLWYFLHVRSGHFHHENITLHAELGPIVRVAPGMYSINYPDKNIYGIGSRFKKSNWYEGWKHPSSDRWTLFTDQDTKRHAETRKKFQNLYSMSSLVSYEEYVNECMDIFLKKLTSFADARKSIDMAHWFQCYAFDVMGDITYSERFGFLDNGEDIAGMLAALDSSMVYSTLAGIFSWAHPSIYAVLEKIPGSGAAGRAFLMNFVQKKIVERNQARANLKLSDREQVINEDAPRDFLDKLTDAHERNPNLVTPYHIFMMGLSNINAGSDTTAVSLSSILYNLIKYPSTMTRLREEVKEYDARHDPSTKFIPFKESRAMPYLQAVIKEGLRLHPATGLPLWRVVPEGGCSIAGHQIPAGSTVGINSWVAHYDPGVFGPDVDVFRPERWLEADNEKGSRYQMMEANYLPFGLGSRTCLGRHISTLEMCKLIPELVRNFDFESDMPDLHWETRNYWFVKPVDFRVRCKRRT